MTVTHEALEARLRSVENKLIEMSVKLDLQYKVAKGLIAVVSLTLGIDVLPLLGGV